MTTSKTKGFNPKRSVGYMGNGELVLKRVSDSARNKGGFTLSLQSLPKVNKNMWVRLEEAARNPQRTRGLAEIGEVPSSKKGHLKHR